MSVLTVFRTHPLIHFSYVAALLPVVALLANGVMSTTVLVVYGATVAFAHSNTRLGFGPLERVFVSPNYHRIHHKVDGPQDVTVIAWWATSFVPPEPKSTSQVLLDDELPAGTHTIVIPDEVPAQASFATVSVGPSVRAFIVGPMPSGTTLARFPDPSSA